MVLHSFLLVIHQNHQNPFPIIHAPMRESYDDEVLKHALRYDDEVLKTLEETLARGAAHLGRSRFVLVLACLLKVGVDGCW